MVTHVLNWFDHPLIEASLERQLAASRLTTCRDDAASAPAMLEKGASQPWQKTLFEMTGERQIDATAMIEYFDQQVTAWQPRTLREYASEERAATEPAIPLNV